MSRHDRDHSRVRIVCTRAKELDACTNRRRYYLDEIQKLTLSGLRDHLADPRAIAQFLHTYQEERKRLAAKSVNTKRQLETRLAEVTRELNRAVDFVLKGSAPVETFTTRIQELDAEKRQIEVELAAAEHAGNVIRLHPGAVARYLETVEQLAATIDGADVDAGQAEAVRSLIECVTVQHQAKGDPLVLEVYGRLAVLLGVDAFPQARLVGG